MKTTTSTQTRRTKKNSSKCVMCELNDRTERKKKYGLFSRIKQPHSLIRLRIQIVNFCVALILFFFWFWMGCFCCCCCCWLVGWFGWFDVAVYVLYSFRYDAPYSCCIPYIHRDFLCYFFKIIFSFVSNDTMKNKRNKKQKKTKHSWNKHSVVVVAIFSGNITVSL